MACGEYPLLNNNIDHELWKRGTPPHNFAILCQGLLTETTSINRLVPIVNDGKYLCLSMMTILRHKADHPFGYQPLTIRNRLGFFCLLVPRMSSQYL